MKIFHEIHQVIRDSPGGVSDRMERTRRLIFRQKMHSRQEQTERRKSMNSMIANDSERAATRDSRSQQLQSDLYASISNVAEVPNFSNFH